MPYKDKAAKARMYKTPDATNLTVVDILRKFLMANKFGGLCNDECGCRLDDLCPCGEIQPSCTPGKRVKCDCEDHDGWHIEPIS